MKTFQSAVHPVSSMALYMTKTLYPLTCIPNNGVGVATCEIRPSTDNMKTVSRLAVWMDIADGQMQQGKGRSYKAG
jgi:hypothetical protein